MRVFRETRCGKTKKDGHKHTSACYGGPWYIDYIDNDGMRRREVGGYAKRDAAAVLARVREEIRQGKYVRKEGQKKFSEFAEVYITFAKNNKKSWERDMFSLRKLLPFFKDRRLKDIKPALIEAYKAKRKKEVKDSTINRELACMKHMYTLAVKWGETASNPVKHVSMFKERPSKMRILSYEEEQKLLEACNNTLRPIIITALETGMRRNEILGLRRRDVDLGAGSIRVEETKNGESRVIPVSSMLYGVLARLGKNGEYIFSQAGGGAVISVRTAFENAVKRAGIPHIRFHDLRHTFGSRAVMSGVDLVTVKELMGHKSINMTMRYSHPTPEHKKMAVERLRTNIFDSKVDSFEDSKAEDAYQEEVLSTTN